MKDVQLILGELGKKANARTREIMIAKRNGKKVVEYFGDFVPEQWIWAAGAEPYLICKGGDPQAPEATQQYMLRFMNPLSSSLAGNYLRGMDQVMENADTIVVQQHDGHYGRATEILEFKGLQVYKVGVPADYTSGISGGYYRNELKELRAHLESVVGAPINDDEIRKNYEKTNKINALLRRINEMRKRENPPITFGDFIRLNHYTLRLDYDTSIEALERLCELLENAEGAYKSGSPRVLIMGRAVAEGDYSVPDLVENSGGMIVTEFLDECIRPYNCSIDTQGDVTEAYAKAIYDEKMPPCIFQPSWEKRYEHLLELAKDYKVDGIILYQLAFDEIYDMEFATVQKHLDEAGIPALKLESSYEYQRESMGPLTTRIESYIESLRR